MSLDHCANTVVLNHCFNLVVWIHLVFQNHCFQKSGELINIFYLPIWPLIFGGSGPLISGGFHFVVTTLCSAFETLSSIEIPANPMRRCHRVANGNEQGSGNWRCGIATEKAGSGGGIVTALLVRSTEAYAIDKVVKERRETLISNKFHSGTQIRLFSKLSKIDVV